MTRIANQQVDVIGSGDCDSGVLGARRRVAPKFDGLWAPLRQNPKRFIVTRN